MSAETINLPRVDFTKAALERIAKPMRRRKQDWRIRLIQKRRRIAR